MTLPELDTGNISYIGFYNAIDSGGVAAIDPTEAESALIKSAQYSNGVDGQTSVQYTEPYSSTPITITLNCRIKDDGWVIVWLDRTENFFVSNDAFNMTYENGKQDLVWNALEPSADGIEKTSISKAIEDIINALPNGGSISFQTGDESYYNFEHEGSTNIGVFGANDESITTTIDAGVTLNEWITVYYRQNENSGSCEFAGRSRGNGAEVIDSISLGLVAPDTTVQSNAVIGQYGSGTQVSHIVCWK